MTPIVLLIVILSGTPLTLPMANMETCIAQGAKFTSAGHSDVYCVESVR